MSTCSSRSLRSRSRLFAWGVVGLIAGGASFARAQAPDCFEDCDARFREAFEACIGPDGQLDPDCAARLDVEFAACLEGCGVVVDPEIDCDGDGIPDDPADCPPFPDDPCIECDIAFNEALERCFRGEPDPDGGVDAECLAAADVAFVACMEECGGGDPGVDCDGDGIPNDPADCEPFGPCPECDIALRAALADCADAAGELDAACAAAAQAAHAACMEECAANDPFVCLFVCEGRYVEALRDCAEETEDGEIVLDPDCATTAHEAFEACVAECELPDELLCMTGCDSALAAELSVCREPGCEIAAFERYSLCLETCGVVGLPPLPEPDPCLDGCAAAYDRALSECFDPETGEVADPECFVAADEAFARCMEECGVTIVVPPGADPCVAPCDEEYARALDGCFSANGAIDEACLAAADARYIECLRECGVEIPEVPDLPPPPGCVSDCADAIFLEFERCVNAQTGEIDEACLLALEARLEECVAACEDGDDAENRAIVAAIRGAGAASFLRGDADFDASRTLTDAIVVLDMLFRGGEPLTCPDAADANDDGRVDISDAVALLGHLFLGTGPLPPPSDAAGSDPTDDDLGCLRRS